MFERRLEVDAIWTHPKTVTQLKEGLGWIDETVRHEMQHMAQDILRDLLELRDRAGLPSPEIRDLYVNSLGINPKNYNQPMKDHALRDVEFYPRLADEIESFIRQYKDTEDDWRFHLRERLKGNGNAFFKALRIREPLKWQKVVKEMTKAVNDAFVKP